LERIFFQLIGKKASLVSKKGSKIYLWVNLTQGVQGMLSLKANQI